VERVAERADQLLRGAGSSAAERAAGDLPAFARLLRSEPRLRAALTDISTGGEAKRELLRSLLADRVDAASLDLIGLLADELLSPDELQEAAADLAVRALLAGADAAGELEDVEDELFRFARVIDGTPALRSALTDPGLGGEAKLSLVGDLLEEQARASTVRLVEFVVSTGEERDPARALQELAELAAQRRGRLVVEARTAVPIDVQRSARLEEALSRVVGREVDLEVVVDPDVVGGVVARVGDEIIDGTVKRKLELALEQLTN
jgi:F-type H+-transporting ATPase subunit delta